MIIENAEAPAGLPAASTAQPGRSGNSQPLFAFQTGFKRSDEHRLNAMRESQDGFYLAEQDHKTSWSG